MHALKRLAALKSRIDWRAARTFDGMQTLLHVLMCLPFAPLLWLVALAS
jgi:hypothetical protein